MTKPTEEEALKAVRTLLAFTGDDPDREGLIETPDRVVRAYREFYAGYEVDPEEIQSEIQKQLIRFSLMDSNCKLALRKPLFDSAVERQRARNPF